MDFDAAVIESTDDGLQQQTDASSSDDLQTTLQAAFREVEGRQRDEQGRFASSAAVLGAKIVDKVASPAPAPAANEPAPAPAPTDGAPTAPAPAPVAAAPRAPDAWSPAAKAKFATLDPEVQAEIARREAEVHKGFTKQDEQRNLGKSIEQTYAPYMAMVRAEGGDPVRTTQVLLQTAYTLRHGTPEQKEHLVLGLMQQYAVDPNRVFQRLAGGQQTQQVHPQVAQLQAQVERLQRAEQERMQSTQSQEQAQIGQTIERFASDPKNVYFANVRNDMGSLMDSASKQGRELSLQEAYDMACWARPDIRPLLQQKIDLQRAADAQAKAKKARAAGSSLTGSPSGSSAAAAAATSTGSLEDDIRATWREVMNRE